jgi:hypothetical protein
LKLIIWIKKKCLRSHVKGGIVYHVPTSFSF